MIKLTISATVDSLEDTNSDFLILSKFESVEKLYCYLELMKSAVITSFSIIDKRKQYMISSGVKNYYNSKHNELNLSEETVDILLKMIVDVLLNQAFIGYHYDFSVDSNKAAAADVCFVFL